MPRTTVLFCYSVAIALLATSSPAEGQAYRTIVGTPHDFSAVTGSGSDGCGACHLPSADSGAKGGGDDFVAYGFVSGVPGDEMGQETQSCLSCHDGMGSDARVAFGLGPGQGSHPTSVRYDPSASAGLRHEADVEARGLKLHGASGSPRMECTSCHNPHDNTNGNFLRISNRGSALCLSCHVK